MNRIANDGTRPYRSRLRAEQAEETRGRILDAAVRVMADGVASLSVPAVAREAGVSVPTVYRHFRTKNELLAALYPHVERRAGFRDLVVPRSLDELRGGLRGILDRIDSFDDLARAAMASPAAEEARRLSMPRRVAAAERLLDSVQPKLVPAHRDRIVRLMTVLIASSSLRTWRDHLGAPVEQVIDDIEWVLRVAVAAAERER